LSTADVQCADDEREAIEGFDDPGDGLVLLVLPGGSTAPEEEELCAHEADALGPGLDRGNRLLGPVDVGHDLHSVPVAHDRGLVAGAVLLVTDGRDVALGLTGGFDVTLVNVVPQGTGGSVEHHGCVVRRRQRRRPRADDGRDAEGPGDDRGVRGRTAQRRAEPDDALGVDGRGVRR
jgi:hypothetical protein